MNVIAWLEYELAFYDSAVHRFNHYTTRTPQEEEEEEEEEEDLLSPVRRQNLVKKKREKKRICQIVNFSVPIDHRLKLKECVKRDMYLHLAREQKNLCDIKVTTITNCNWWAQYHSQKTGKGIGKLRNKKASRVQTNDSSIKIGQNTEKCPEHLRRLAVTQAPVENHHLTLVWKTLKAKKEIST